jgi:hypothetical protein
MFIAILKKKKTLNKYFMRSALTLFLGRKKIEKSKQTVKTKLKFTSQLVKKTKTEVKQKGIQKAHEEMGHLSKARK